MFFVVGLSGSLRLNVQDHAGSSDNNAPIEDDEGDDGWDLDDVDDDDEMDRSADAFDSKQHDVAPANNGVLLIVIGVVIGVAVVSVILIVAACIWRQRQQRLQRPVSKLPTLSCSRQLYDATSLGKRFS